MPDLLAIEGLRACLKPTTELHTTLLQYLNPDEIAALDLRAETLIALGEFPLPPRDRRVYPYPPL